MSKPFYITTAIDYANGAPHLGHAYEKVLTDVISRFQRAQGQTVHFLTGLDEHGQKVQQNAQKLGIAPQDACDQTAVLFRQLLVDLNITNNDFIRTTEPRHKSVVQECLQKLFDQGLIYKAEFVGHYSVRQEQFVLEKDKNDDGTWPEIYGEVVAMTEQNYFFRLTKYQEWLKEFLDKNPDWIFPKFRQKQVVEFLKEPVNDLCISRPKERLSWGIELPFDKNFVTYVWFDALINYYSAVTGTEHWTAGAHHVIGKDILVPAHAVYWPCMLKALEIPLPAQLIVHGWWTISGAKASKSTGNALNTLALAKTYGTDPFRYYLIREMNVGQDSDFSEDQFKIRYKTDLGNGLGNLLNRLLNMGARYCAGNVPAQRADADGSDEKELRTLWAETAPKYLDLSGEYQFHTALEILWNFVRALNRYVENTAPWKLGKSEAPADRAKLETCLAHVAEGLRLTAIALLPVMPTISGEIQKNIGLTPAENFTGELDWSEKCLGKKLAEKAILFPPIEETPAA